MFSWVEGGGEITGDLHHYQSNDEIKNSYLLRKLLKIV